ncbi:sensor histidine kinase [Streptomyces sp. BI20]|uniref:sensor histidine kinase n=1 Tax=Streptomyces sp. BI20 TaxID=3403460 RepID=UPI003C770912
MNRRAAPPEPAVGPLDGPAAPRAGAPVPTGASGVPGTDPRAARLLAAVVHTAFFLLLIGSLSRYLLRHPGEARIPWVIALSAVLALLYLLGPAAAPPTEGPPPPGRRTPRGPLLRLVPLVAAWVVLVLLAPSFAWCAVPLFHTALRTLRPRAAVVLVTLLTVLVVVAQFRLATVFDPNLLLAPPAVAALATAVFLHMERQAEEQRALIADLLRTRRELAEGMRREGTLAERQRLSAEIHDTIAQHLSSQQMLLQAADRIWDADPGTARAHVRTAGEIAGRGLAEARRLVHDLAPAELAAGPAPGTPTALPGALRALDAGPDLLVRFHVEGAPVPLPAPVEAALLRIAQGALANVREHAGASTAALTLSFLGDQVVLDVADDGRGFTPGAAGGPGTGVRRGRGHGLPAIRARLAKVGGTLTVESAPGEGTVLSAAVPLSGRPAVADPAPSPIDPITPDAPESAR